MEKEIDFLIKPKQVTKINLKPLSVNKCWQGKRFKTPEYKAYEASALLLLPRMAVPPGKLKIILEFGVSNICADIDNPVKPVLDILQKKYWFNDYNIWELDSTKVKVKKGEEYFSFQFISIV